MLRAIFFDLDDTLYDHTIVSRIALQETAKLDEALTRANIDELMKVNAHWLEHFHLEVQCGALSLENARNARWAKIVDHFGGDNAHAPRLAAEQRRAYLANERLIDGAKEMLYALRELGIRLAVVSNNTREEQLGKLSRLGIESFFDVIVVSADHGFAKPDPRLFQLALRSIGCDAAEVVHIGDSWKADVIGAIAAMIRPIWFNRFGLSSMDSRVPEIRRLEALPALLA